MALDLNELAIVLLQRSHRACMHRLRGDTQVLGGWAELGMFGDDASRIRNRVLESQVQMQRLELLWSFVQSATETAMQEFHTAAFWTDDQVQECRLAELFLASAMRFGTPEEADSQLPVIDDPLAGWASSLFLESVLGESMSRQIACTMQADGRFRIRLQGTDLQEAPAQLFTEFGDILSPETIDATQLGVATGLLVRGLSVSLPDPPEVNPSAATRSAKTPADGGKN